MSLPSHVFLPITGAVVLAATVIGTWLWPAPTPPALNLEPPPLATPVDLQPPAPPPPSPPRPSRPVARAAPPAPPAPRVEPPRPVAMAPREEPVQVVPAPSYPQPEVNTQPQESPPPTGPRLTMMERAATLLERGVVPLEKARDEALARGDQAEAQRLDASIRQHRERVDRMKVRANLSETPNGGELPQM